MTVLDLRTFAASTLADSQGLTAALMSLESCLAGSDTPLDLIVQDLCSIPNLFEFMVSALPSGQELVSRIIDAYPTNPALVGASYTSPLLQRVSSVIFALPPDLFSTLTVRQIGQYKVRVEEGLSLLTLLCSTADFSTVFTCASPEIALEDREYNNLSGTSARKKQKKFKQKKKGITPAIDATPFHKLGVKVPSNHAEASKMAHEITDDLKMILKFYLELLLEPFLAQPLKDAYVLTANNTDVRPATPQKPKVLEVVEPKPSAYPKVQPIKAAIYFENADDFGEWRIIISTNATKKLRELAKDDGKKCAIVVKKIKQLSNGHFSNDNQKRLNGPSCGVPIFEAKMQRDLRLVYQVDVVPDYNGNVERQVIKIYGIYTHTQLNRIWDAMGQYLAGKGKEYNRRCIFRNKPVQPGGDIYLPACFPPEILENDTKPTPLLLSDGDMGELHSLLVLDKYITFSQAFLHSLLANQDVQHVFELTPEERRIVECETSCYVLGRSGTGKTTTMLFKMLGIERAWQMQMSSSNIPKPRQIFVTKSRVLATKVEEYFTKLIESLVLAGYSLEELKKMQARSAEAGLVDADRADIPEKYSLLEEKHFPLFVTYDQLARMIAADVLTGDDPDVQYATKFFIGISDEIEAEESFVSYDVFVRTYWPHFPHPLPKGLEPWLVFSEFIGIIKGSEKSLTCPHGFLDEATYCGLSARSNPMFANHRETLYALFEAYCKLKKERRHYDVADRTHAILKALLGGTLSEWKRVDYLYVDEAQDNLLIDALLLRLICRNPEGLFWAGDTAQTISAGSSFRFDDLKAFLYRIERNHNPYLVQDQPVTGPSVFQLAINYRSHGGIVNCAHTVIERIMHFWPDAIDRLKPERGIVDGLKPVFFHGWDQDTIRYEEFLFGGSGNRIEFGAQQCILVRDEKAQEKLRQDIGDVGLIMTLYDSKGLEFNDVLLYNFFEGSTVDLSQWFVLLNDTEGEVDGKNLAEVYAPSFGRDEDRFAGVCSELKLLYVGITRARKNLWIVDKSEKCEPMRMIWTSRNQIRNCIPGMVKQAGRRAASGGLQGTVVDSTHSTHDMRLPTPTTEPPATARDPCHCQGDASAGPGPTSTTDIPHLAVSSTDAEWESFGRDLLKHEKYRQAMHCFTRASMPLMATICEAFHLRQLARAKVGVEPRKAQQDAFLAAANALFAATNAFTTDALAAKDRLQYYRNAAECYIRAGDDRKAAIAYYSAQEYDLAARRFRKAGLFHRTLEVLHQYSERMSSACSEELYTVCRLFYCTKADGKRPHLPLFSSFEEEEQFLKDYDLDFARATLLESHGRYLEAAEIHLSEHRPLDAIKDLLKEKGSRDAAQRATKILLDELWHRCSFAIAPKDMVVDQGVTELLNLACEFPTDFMDPLDCHELSMFQAITRADFASLGELANEFIKGNRRAAALLALDHFFSRLPNLKSYKIHEMSSFLAQFLEYAQLLYFVISYPDPLSVNSIRRLFCIREKTNTEYSLQPGSFLHNSSTSDRNGPLCTKGSAKLPSKNDIVTALRKYLSEHLRERAMEENELCRETPVFSQCLSFIMTNCCNSASCTKEHVKHEELDPKRYNLRLGIHLQQIYIVQLMFSANPCSLVHVQDIMLEWLTYIYEALNPQSHVQGSIGDFDLSSIPGAQEGMRAMKHWVRGALYALRPDHWDYLTTMLRLTSLLFTFDRSSALVFINRAHFSRHSRIKQLIYRDGHWVVEDIVKFFDGTHYLCIPAGSRFLDHVLRSSQAMDLSVLCDRIEEQVSKISIASRLFSLTHTPLDGIVLPRSWLLANPDLSNKKSVWIGATLETVLESVKGLLTYLQSDTATPIYTLLDTGLTQTLRNVFIARICRALSFLIYNISNHDIRQKIRDIFNALRPTNPVQRAHPMYRKYAVTCDFTDYLKVALEYDTESRVVIEDVVQLLHKKRSSRQARPLRMPRIKDIYFTSPSEVPPLLSTRFVEALSGLHLETPAAIRRNTPQIKKAETQAEATMDRHAPKNDQSTEQEITAAKKIQATYRQYRKRCDGQTRAFGRGLKAKKNSVFAKCVKNVYASDWGKTPYRTLYLWTLPRLVICLDRAVEVAHDFKDKTKRQLSENHERLEERGMQISRICALLKNGHLLQRRIEPNATMHQAQNRDKAALKKAVLDVKDVIDNLPVPAPDIQEDFDFVYARVVAEKEQALEPVKPELNTEDLDLYCQY